VTRVRKAELVEVAELRQLLTRIVEMLDARHEG
jgi:hypothetical protein